MSNCKHFKIRKHDNKREKRIYYYCTLLKKEITYCQCQGCDKKEYKSSGFKRKNPVKCGDSHTKLEKKTVKMKNRTYKQTKKEKNRYSLFTEDLTTCIECGKSKQHLHEIFGGRNRSNSIEYGLVLPLCSTCHRRIHDTPYLIDEWHKKGQAKFNETYPILSFIDIFYRNYL